MIINPPVFLDLRKSLYAHKVSYITQSLNTIAGKHEYDPTIDVRCNGL